MSLCLDFALNHTADTHQWAARRWFNYWLISRENRVIVF